MMKSERIVRIGTRGSKLALLQTEEVTLSLKKTCPDLQFETVIIKTSGDKYPHMTLSEWVSQEVQSLTLDVSPKALFTKEIEEALYENRIDMAVHSFKDMTSQLPPGLAIGAFFPRTSPFDAFIGKTDLSLEQLPLKAVIATGSIRRRASLLRFRPDFKVVDIRGNVETRLKKFDESNWDGMVLAEAGLQRLGFSFRITQVIPREIMLPAPGQGTIAVEIREEDEELKEILAKVNDRDTETSVKPEKTFLHHLGGGCLIPVGALGTIEKGIMTLEGEVISPDGSKSVRHQMSAPVGMESDLGVSLAEYLLKQGAEDILNR